MPNPRGSRPGSRGIRPGAPNRRTSPFDLKPAKRPFKKFTSAFEAFDPIGQQDTRVIDVDDHAVRVVGLPPPSSGADPLNTGILQAMDEAIIEEIIAIAKEN
jgi:hypothetical protein